LLLIASDGARCDRLMPVEAAKSDVNANCDSRKKKSRIGS
jgi:hypothetical protein